MRLRIDIGEYKKKLEDVIKYNDKMKSEIYKLEDLHDNILYNYHDEYEIEDLNRMNDEIEDIKTRVNHLINKLTLLEIKIRAMIDSYDEDKIDRYSREIQQLEDYIYKYLKYIYNEDKINQYYREIEQLEDYIDELIKDR